MFDVYLRLQHEKTLTHIIVTNNYYEKILLLKKIITPRDITYTRRKIREIVGERDYEKIKEIFLHHDDDYLKIVADLSNAKKIDVSDYKRRKKILSDLIYNKKYAEAMAHLTKLHKEKVKKI